MSVYRFSNNPALFRFVRRFERNYLYLSENYETVFGVQCFCLLINSIAVFLFLFLLARRFMAGSQMLRQLYFSALDMELHTRCEVV